MTPKQFLIDLGIRCSPTMSRENAEVVSRDWPKGLSALPPDVFCDAAKEAAAQKFSYFPAYADLYAFLSDWWEAHRPAQLTLPAGDPMADPPYSWGERSWVQGWQDERPRMNEWKMAHRLSVLHMYAPRPFDWICRTDAQAREIAVQRGWRQEPSE